jgi:hypothetical protein
MEKERDMRREIAGARSVPGLATVAAAALIVGLAGCGSSSGGSGASGGSSSSAPTGSTSQAAAGSGALAKSHLRVLTKLKRAQMCGVLTTATATRILGATPGKPLYTSQQGLGTACEWIKKGASATSPDELYVGVPMIVDWAGEQAKDKPLHAKSVKIAGRAALTIAPHPRVPWAQVSVALGGAHDPVAEFRAPTMTGAMALARDATPHLIAMG